MDRQSFIKATGIGFGASMIPGIGLGSTKETSPTETFSEDDLWVLGHKITLYKDSSGDFDLAIGVTPPNVPGPPPHYHETFDELFLVLEGKMEFMVGKKTIKASPGDMVDLPMETVHTFGNDGDKPCKWLNIHSPKGFSAFFEAFGVKATETDALKKSVAEKVIGQVMQQASQFDMIIME
ncbi:MAG: cupin domain-containing protein [Balneolaceae bacterium]|nr:cupin domain-containing protein [Balneolaceae bacterium]